MLAKKTLLNIGSSFLRSSKKPDAGLEHIISGESGTFGKLNLFQSGAAKKCTFTDFGHGIGDFYLHQLFTESKCRLSDTCYTFGYNKLLKSETGKKCLFADFGHGRGNLYVCQMITFIKRRLSDAMIVKFVQPLNTVLPAIFLTLSGMWI